ncbi:YY1-associated protein 1 isoform X2 [Sarcophilus harrisii]|uniref:YY1-associated protein 1 isoform X2 n=1 Tax=Sarcophilus harrisii TaxID=9305 RepID=UPI001301DC4D|nr:YY1-associated protein 1 isoform X2 [Sarcophilus harrisii]
MSKPQGENTVPMMVLDAAQKKRLQQQMQQHVQLLTQIHLLASTNPSLSSEASTTKMFLQFNSKFQTTFQPCNLKGAIQLIEDFHSHVSIDLSPPKKVQKNDEGQNPEYPTNEFPCLPKQVAWILATSKVFMYPELLPIRSLKVKHPKDKIFFTKAEDNLLALGLKHFEGTEFPKPLISKYLLTAKSDHQLTVRIKNLNISRAPDNIIKYYKKTKQLPILFKCCEELQPDQWKPPVEREERHLPFWLKASLPAIQEEIQQLDNDAGGSGDLSRLAETTCDPDLESGSESRYPLLLPKGVVLTLKPLAKRFSSRKIWRQKSVLKPLLIRPAPALQPCSNDSAGGRLAPCETPPRRGEVPDAQLRQPATVLKTGPKASPLGGTGRGGGGIPVNLPPLAPKNTARAQAFLCPFPAAFQSKVLLPSVVAPNRGEPRMKPPKRKSAEASRLLKPAPVLPSPRVILTVPATAMGVVGLNSRFNAIQPPRATAQNPQTIPITTVLVSPTSFICPLNQPLIASSIPPLLVSGNPVNLPVPSTPAENTQAKSGIPGPQPEGESAFPTVDPKQKSQDSSPPCSSPYPKEKHSPGPPPPSGDRQGHLFESNAHSWTVVKMLDGRQVLQPLSRASQMAINCLPENLLKIVKVEPEEFEEEASWTWNRFPEPDICDEIKKEVSTESEVEPPYEEADSAAQVKQEADLQEEEGETAVGTPGEGKPGGKMSKGSPKNTSSSTNPDTILRVPLGKPEDSFSVVGLTVRTHAGPETGDEKLKPKEEEEDFDEDEEMTSDSEDDVPFVPEFQETVEKPTCLVSGRCVGQESDSKEEKPWKENSCPEAVVKLEKDDEMMDEADRDPSFHPCFT